MKIEHLPDVEPFKNGGHRDHANGVTDDEKALTVSKDIRNSESFSIHKEGQRNGFNLENGINGLSYKGKNKNFLFQLLKINFGIFLHSTGMQQL